MIKEIFSTFKHQVTVIDFKRKKFVEKRTLGEVLIEIFGDTFGFHWFIPFSQGGFYKYFNRSILKASYTYEDNTVSGSNANKEEETTDQPLNENEENSNKPDDEKKND